MLHRTCENMPRDVRVGGLSMPNGWCTLCMPIYLKTWGIKKYSIPYMVQIELTYFLFKSGVVNPYMDSLIVLEMPWSSLPIIWKLSCVVIWPVMQLWLCIGEGYFRRSLNLSSKVLEVSPPIYSSSHASSPHWNQ